MMGKVAAEGIIDVEAALMEWVSECPIFETLKSEPMLSYLREHSGACAIRPVAGAAASKEFIGGGNVVDYEFALEMMLPLSLSTDCVNLDNARLGRVWESWIEKKESAGEYPELGEGACCLTASCISNMPQVAQVFEGGVARYRFPARLVYIK